MDELFELLRKRTANFEKLGFKILNINRPKGASFGISWHHKQLDLFFSVVWDRMEMLLISCNVKEIRRFKPFYITLDEMNIHYEKEKIYYQLPINDQFNKVIFSDVLDYNLKKLGELIMLLE